MNGPHRRHPPRRAARPVEPRLHGRDGARPGLRRLTACAPCAQPRCRPHSRTRRAALRRLRAAAALEDEATPGTLKAAILAGGASGVAAMHEDEGGGSPPGAAWGWHGRRRSGGGAGGGAAAAGPVTADAETAVVSEAVQNLLAMGFSLPRAVQAHAQFGDDLESMLAYLLDS